MSLCHFSFVQLWIGTWNLGKYYLIYFLTGLPLYLDKSTYCAFRVLRVCEICYVQLRSLGKYVYVCYFALVNNFFVTRKVILESNICIAVQTLLRCPSLPKNKDFDLEVQKPRFTKNSPEQFVHVLIAR